MGRSFGPEMVKVISSPRPGLMLPLLPFLPMLPLRRPANMPANAAHRHNARFWASVKLGCKNGPSSTPNPPNYLASVQMTPYTLLVLHSRPVTLIHLH